MRQMILAVTMFLSACGAAQLQDASAIRPAEELPIKLQDLRPEAEKATDKGSLLVTACAYGIYRYGDERLTPRPPLYLANYLNRHFAPQGGDDTFTLYRLRIVYNAQAALRGATYGSNPGLVSAVMSGNSCVPGVDTPGGVDYPTEDPGSAPIMLIYLEGDFRGHHYETRHLEPLPPRSDQFKAMFPALDHAFDEAFGGKGEGR